MIKIPRVHIEGALYYVTSRGDHNEDIFRDEGDYKQYLELLKKYKEQYGFKLFTFVLMPNHLHLLVELKEGLTISDIMHDLNSNYTKYFNRRYERKGHLFQERYKMALVEKESYLLYLTAYIHLNPLNLRLVENLADYPNSSYLYYIDRGTEELKNQRTEELGLGEEIKEVKEILGAKSYEEFLRGLKKEEMEGLTEELSKKNILGSDEFTKKIEVKLEMERLKKKEKPQIHKRLVLVGGLAVAVMAITGVFLYTANRQLKGRLEDVSYDKEIGYSQKLSEEREMIKKDLEELHKADLVSYQAMVKRLEIEKKRAKELEEKLK